MDSKLWVSFAALADIIGRDRAQALCSARGGVRVYIPKSAESAPDLERIVGPPALRALISVYGGCYITTPNHRRGKPKKADVIRLLESGESVRKIALRLDVTERYVEYLASLYRTRPKQGSLFTIL